MKVLNEWFIDAPWGKIARVMLTRMHFVGTINIVLQHLKWTELVYIGHSMGTEQGLFFNAAYPGRIKKFVLLDPGPSFTRLLVHDPEEYMKSFYEYYYSNLPKFAERTLYSKRKILDSVKKARELTDEQAELILSRNLTKVGDDLYQLSWDKRLKFPAPQNFPTEFYYELWSKNAPPTLLIAAKEFRGGYSKGRGQAEKLIADMESTVKNFIVVKVDGSHDVHFTNPERFVKELCGFLDKKFECKSKL